MPEVPRLAPDRPADSGCRFGCDPRVSAAATPASPARGTSRGAEPRGTDRDVQGVKSANFHRLLKPKTYDSNEGSRTGRRGFHGGCVCRYGEFLYAEQHFYEPDIMLGF